MSRGYADLALALVAGVAAPRRAVTEPTPRPGRPVVEDPRPRQARHTYAPGVDWLAREFPGWDVRLVGARSRVYVATRGADVVRARTVAEAAEGMRAADNAPAPSPVRPYLSR